VPIRDQYLADFTEGEIYHVYNRSNNKELLFINDDNRLFFLKKYKEIVAPFVDSFCWCLLPNHFHLLIRIKTEIEIKAVLAALPKTNLSVTARKFINNDLTLNKFIVHTFKRLFQSYALSFNKVHGRQGNLFYKPFKRLCIIKDDQFSMAIIYIHANAMKHKLVKDFRDYRWSSWHTITSKEPTMLLRNEVIEWFGDLAACIKAHEEVSAYYFESVIGIE
jgi:REP element-mobilizing transposase RayT